MEMRGCQMMNYKKAVRLQGERALVVNVLKLAVNKFKNIKLGKKNTNTCMGRTKIQNHLCRGV